MNLTSYIVHEGNFMGFIFLKLSCVCRNFFKKNLFVSITSNKVGKWWNHLVYIIVLISIIHFRIYVYNGLSDCKLIKKCVKCLSFCCQKRFLKMICKDAKLITMLMRICSLWSLFLKFPSFIIWFSKLYLKLIETFPPH